MRNGGLIAGVLASFLPVTITPVNLFHTWHGEFCEEFETTLTCFGFDLKETLSPTFPLIIRLLPGQFPRLHIFKLELTLEAKKSFLRKGSS